MVIKFLVRAMFNNEAFAPLFNYYVFNYAVILDSYGCKPAAVRCYISCSIKQIQFKSCPSLNDHL